MYMYSLYKKNGTVRIFFLYEICSNSMCIWYHIKAE